jgi:hypothetical protein
MVKRIKRTKRIGTDFASPSAHPHPPQAAKIRFHPFHPFHPFSNHAALACLLPPLKTPNSTRQFVIRHSKNSSLQSTNHTPLLRLRLLFPKRQDGKTDETD